MKVKTLTQKKFLGRVSEDTKKSLKEIKSDIFTFKNKNGLSPDELLDIYKNVADFNRRADEIFRSAYELNISGYEEALIMLSGNVEYFNLKALFSTMEILKPLFNPLDNILFIHAGRMEDDIIYVDCNIRKKKKIKDCKVFMEKDASCRIYIGLNKDNTHGIVYISKTESEEIENRNFC